MSVGASGAVASEGWRDAAGACVSVTQRDYPAWTGSTVGLTPRDSIGHRGDARRALRALLLAVRAPVHRVDPVDAHPAQRLGLPGRRAVPDPRQAGQLGVAPQDEVAQRAAGEIGRRDAVADVAAGPRGAGRRVGAHGRAPVPRDPEHARPGVLDAHVLEPLEQTPEAVAQLGDRAVGDLAGAVGPR